MNNKLFQNDHITGNATIGINFRGCFKDDENIMIEKLKDVLNREVSFSNIDYKLLEPSDTQAILIQDGDYFEIKTPMYNYFEAMFVLPKVLDFLKNLKNYNNSYLHFRLGFNNGFCSLDQLNIMKFVLMFNEDYILKHLYDITNDGNIEKITDIKPLNLEDCNDDINKIFNKLKYNDDDIYGINFSTANFGYIIFKYAQDINYRDKWNEILKCVNHTIITLYNACTIPQFDDEETKKIEELNNQYKEILSAFGCYEIFKDKFKKVKLTKDLNNDVMDIELIFPAIKDKLFNIVIKNNIKDVEVNYDSDLSKLQLKGLELKNCNHISGVDIVDSELENCRLMGCDVYDTKIIKSKISKCNLFGYADCKDSKIIDSFVSRNIKLKDCNVSGSLGKMAGTMKGGSLKNTTVITSMAEIDDDVKKINVNEIK